MSQPEELTATQLAKLTEIAKNVVASYEHLELIEILNRIHLITNLDYQRCIAGFKKMFAHGLIKPEFVLNLQRLPALEKQVAVIFPFIDSMDLEFVKPGTFEGLGKVTEVANTMSDGPTDDEDEPEPMTAIINLSHLNADF